MGGSISHTPRDPLNSQTHTILLSFTHVHAHSHTYDTYIYIHVYIHTHAQPFDIVGEYVGRVVPPEQGGEYVATIDWEDRYVLVLVWLIGWMGGWVGGFLVNWLL
jgi:hypothetical protein